MTKVLFILKYREVSDPENGVYSYTGLSSGLFNSARMVSEMLNADGLHGEECESKLVQVIDTNSIDREVTAFCQVAHSKPQQYSLPCSGRSSAWVDYAVRQGKERLCWNQHKGIFERP